MSPYSRATDDVSNPEIWLNVPAMTTLSSARYAVEKTGPLGPGEGLNASSGLAYAPSPKNPAREISTLAILFFAAPLMSVKSPPTRIL
jgi:hypothetical protein